MIIIESFFLIHFLLQFILEYQIEGYPPVRDISKIAKNYIYQGSFTIDLICLLPLTVVQLRRNRQLLFFIVKLIRLMKGFSLLDVQKLMNSIKKRQLVKSQQLVEAYPDMANDTVVDHNFVEEFLMVSYSLQILKLFIIISNISYLTGVVWFTICEFIRDFVLDIDGTDSEDPNPNSELYPPGFLVEYGIFDNESYKN